MPAHSVPERIRLKVSPVSDPGTPFQKSSGKQKTFPASEMLQSPQYPTSRCFVLRDEGNNVHRFSCEESQFTWRPWLAYPFTDFPTGKGHSPTFLRYSFSASTTFLHKTWNHPLFPPLIKHSFVCLYVCLYVWAVPEYNPGHWACLISDLWTELWLYTF